MSSEAAFAFSRSSVKIIEIDQKVVNFDDEEDFTSCNDEIYWGDREGTIDE